MDGKKILEEIRKINRTVPVVFMSGQADLEYEDMIELGASYFIQKPFKIEQALKITDNFIKDYSGNKT